MLHIAFVVPMPAPLSCEAVGRSVLRCDTFCQLARLSGNTGVNYVLLRARTGMPADPIHV
jgi:hypothetical protein